MSAAAHPVLWRPSAERIESSNLHAFRRAVEQRLGRRFSDYGELHQWSIDEPGAFWEAIWEVSGVVGAMGERVVERRDGDDPMLSIAWFPEARLNFAQNLLRRSDSGTALVARREDGSRRVLSWADLHAETARWAQLLRRAGVEPGDRVAAVLPNVPETVICMLATASLGAVFSSTSPDFGLGGVLDRFQQIEPKLLVHVDGYSYNGRDYPLVERFAELTRDLPSVERSFALAFRPDAERAVLPSSWSWVDEELATVGEASLEFAPLPFAQPLYILFSSGTTGPPKCITHGAGGTLLQHLKEHRLHVDLGPDDVLFYFTTCGWMMWNWLVSALAGGSTLVLYEGSPTWPEPDSLFAMADEEGITVFGTSAKFIDACSKAGLRPGRDHDLGALRAVLSTGSPLLPAGFDYVYEQIKGDVHLASISGGTDIVSCFVLGNPTAPVRRGEIQCAGLGMAVEVFDETGQRVVGEEGELVCTRPFPSMPVGFWGDEDGSRYRAAYFETYPGVWRHGDWIVETENGGYVIRGRSDAVLNPGGVRIGTAEIYRQVERFDEVLESVVVAQDWDGDVRVVLFVRLQPGARLGEELRQHIRSGIRSNVSPRHVPAVILEVGDVPRTRSGKISELAVRDAIHGREIPNTEALANPEALEEYRRLAAEPPLAAPVE